MLHPTSDFRNNFSLSFGANLTTQTDNTAISSTITRDGSQQTALALLVGTAADSDMTVALTLQESDDNSTFTTVAAKDFSGSLTGVQFDSDNTIRVINYHGSKKYVKLTATPSNNTGSLTWGIINVLGNGRVTP